MITNPGIEMSRRKYLNNTNETPRKWTRENMLGPQIEDIEVAGRVRMLYRDQLDHEFICTLARDRIMVLMAEKKALEDEIESLHLDAAGASA